MKLRSLLFKYLDVLKGGVISGNLKEIELVNEQHEEEFIINYQLNKLKECIVNAQKNTNFYKNYNSIALNDYPIVNKVFLKDNLQDFISKDYQLEKLSKLVTSGSTGTPFVSYQDIGKRNRNSADAIYFGGLAGYTLGDILFYLKIWSTNNKKSKFLQYAQNIHPVDVINFSGENIESFLYTLNKTRGTVCMNGYASSLEALCKYIDNKPNIIKKGLKIGSILAQSEALPNHTKERLHNYFNCLPCSRYSNVENGIIAQQTKKDNNRFKINRASYIVEVLKMDSYSPSDAGELGRIVVTDLFNFGMPFIRYDTGDIGKFDHDSNGNINRNFLTQIQGRRLDLLLNTKGEVISSYIMYKNMFAYPEIDQYQLIQQSRKDYHFIISIKERFKKEESLKKEFLTYLGSDANFEIKYVDKIPLLASGKRRKIVNNYLKNKTEQ